MGTQHRSLSPETGDDLTDLITLITQSNILSIEITTLKYHNNLTQRGTSVLLYVNKIQCLISI